MSISARCFNRQRAMAKAACFKIVFVFSVTGETEPSKLRVLVCENSSTVGLGISGLQGRALYNEVFLWSHGECTSNPER